MLGDAVVRDPANTSAHQTLLFVRTDRDAPFAFLGEAKFESATGDRPIAITWLLANAIPGGLFREFNNLAQG